MIKVSSPKFGLNLGKGKPQTVNGKVLVNVWLDSGRPKSRNKAKDAELACKTGEQGWPRESVRSKSKNQAQNTSLMSANLSRDPFK
jgi:hypothetical protein